MDHIVIDEAQDFGPVEFAIMMDAVHDKRQVTIVGDVAQKILIARKFIGWNKVVENLGLDDDAIIRLEVSFRCTVPIMTLAHKVAGDPKKVEGRDGSAPIWQQTENYIDLIKTAIKKELGPDLIFVVLNMSKDDQKARVFARHGDGEGGGITDMLLKIYDKYEPAKPNEENAINVSITNNMSRDDVVQKILELLP